MLRLTWVQPEDLLGHELHQASQDGRSPSAIASRWRAAGGPEAPLRAGASPTPASPYLRILAKDLLDELADLPSKLAEHEPAGLTKIRTHCPDWPTQPDQPGGSRPAHPAGSPAAGAAPVPKRGGALSAPVSAPTPSPAPTQARLEAAWLGRAVGCLLGKPVEKLPSKASAPSPGPPATGPSTPGSRHVASRTTS